MDKKFKVYNELKSKSLSSLVGSNKEDGKFIDANILCMTINNLPKEHIEFLYSLILNFYFIYSLENGKSLEMAVNDIYCLSKTTRKNFLPFGGKLSSGGKGILYKFDDFPFSLKEIIVKYIYSISDSP